METGTTSAASPPSGGAIAGDTHSAVTEAFDRLAAEGSADPVQPDVREPAGGEDSHADHQVDRARDQQGRFAKAQAQEPVEVLAGAGEVEPARPLGPPQDWRAEARAEWAKLPRAVQEEAVRLHLETKKTLQDSAEAKRAAAEWREVLAPYDHLFREAGLSSVQAVGNVIRHFAALQTAPLPVRARIIAQLTRDCLGADEGALTMLAQALDGHAGAAPAAGDVPPAPATSPEVTHEQLQAYVQDQVREALVREDRRAALTAWRDFKATKPEFLNEVRKELAAELGVAMQLMGGGRATAEDIRRAYDAACRRNPKIKAIVEQREAAETARKSAGDQARRAAAASGVKSEPAGPGAGSTKAKNTREEVSRQFDRLSRARI